MLGDWATGGGHRLTESHDGGTVTESHDGEEAALWMEAAQYSLMGGDHGLLVVASEKVVGVTTADDMNAAMMQVLRQADSSKVQRRGMQVMPRSSVVCPHGGRGTTVAHVSTTCGACSEPPS